MPNPRAQKPLTLDQVKKDLLSFKEPATALADMIAGGFRGLAQGTIGMPGEIESLGRSAINFGLASAPKNKPYIEKGIKPPQISEESALPNMEDAERYMTNLFGTVIPESAPNRKSREHSANYGRTFGQLGVLPGTSGAVKLATYGAGRGAGALTRAGLEQVNKAHLFGEGPLAPFTPQVQNIVKSGGGNWLRQGLDEQRMLGDAGRGRAQSIWNSRDADYKARYPERQLGAVANDTVADWANNNMRKYMANQMGTKNDPVRKLAEQDISHFGMRPDEFGEYPFIRPSDETKRLRKKHTERTGEESPVGESSLAAYWENLSDNAIKATTVGDIKNAPKAGYSFKAKEDIAPYADKVPPETPIYNIDTGDNYQTARQSLGFNRLLEVMREDIAAGRVTPEEVAKWDMEQAVRHVDKRDKAIWKEEAEEADRLAKEFARYFPTLKEYPDKSRWIELKVPDLNDLPKEERLQLIDKLKKEAREKGIDPEQYVVDYPRMKLEEALAHEGEKMGHCVGSYCEDVISGKSRVISYRDANGDAHVTLEVTPPEAGRYPVNEQEFKALPSKQQIEYEHAVRQWRQRNPDVQELEDRHINQALEQAGFQPRPDQIMQIKGKQDAAPVGRYQPYVQDFQRMTKYPIEGDFANSGFDFPATGPRGIFDEDQVKTLRDAGHEVPDYLTQAERENLVRKLYEKETGNDMDTGNPLNPPEPPVEGMKRGGAVHISNNPDTMAMELQDQHYQAGGVVRGLKALKGAMRNPEALVPSARGATKFAETAPKTMNVMKEKGGNWLGGNIAGAVDKRLKSLKTQDRQVSPLFLEDWRQDLKNPSTRGLSDEDVATTQRRLNEHDAENAVNQWIERNVGNYLKKDMATPTDPVRLMIDKRVGEIEAQFQVDMDRAQRTRARAEAEPDPRRQANMMRQAQREEEQATFDRDFAMDHVTHLPKDEFGPDEDALIDLQSKRQQAGFAPEGMATSEPAKRWENISDEAIDIKRAGDIQAQKQLMIDAQNADRALANKNAEINSKFEEYLSKNEKLTPDQKYTLASRTPPNEKAALIDDPEYEAIRNNANDAMSKIKTADWHAGEQNPFISKLDPETSTYSAYIDELGIDHVVDVIKQDLAAGRIRPEQLSKLSMDQAIQRTAEFNMEQAKKMRETAIKNMEGFPTYKDYGDEGYKWIELKRPEDLTELPPTHQLEPYESKVHGGTAYRVVNKETGMKGEGFKTPERATQEFLKEHSEERLAEALKYEGDTMGHCVGGYCPDVLEGRSRIYSLRDKRGEPHVTIEVGKPQVRTEPDEMQKIYDQAVQEANERGLNSNEEFNAFYFDRVKQLQNDLIDRKQANASNVIRQIKGKGNARPIEKYDPYTQDFVRSGEWSDVGDLKNTGLIKHEGKYMTQAEYDDFLLNELRPPEPPAEGMKAGGKVHVSDNCDCMQMELDNKKFAMGGAVEGENDVGSPSPQNSASPVPSYQAGGAVKGLAALKKALTGGSDEAAKAARVAALRQSGLSVAEAKARVELAEQAAEMKQALKASEALARIEGKHLNITQADRTKVGEGYLGGPGFSGLQMKEGPYKDVGAVWGVKNTGTAKTMLGGFDKPLGNEYFTTMIGSPTQHQSNQMVFDKLYKDFTAQAKKGNLDPELRQKINDRLASAVDKDGNAIFPSDIDILSKNFKKQASTFDQRAVAGNVLGGVGIGGKKGQIFDYEKVIRDTTDPFLLDTPSGDLGYRLWTPSGEIIERPDLHPAFPTIATGEDLGVEFAPADKNVLLAPFLEKFRAEKGRDPGYMDMTRGRPVRVQITEPLLKNLQESGNKAGGAVKAKNKYSDGGAISALMKHAETAGQSARMNNQRM